MNRNSKIPFGLSLSKPITERSEVASLALPCHSTSLSPNEESRND
jgi:hypothetical protein